MVHVVQSDEDFEKQISDAGDKLIVIDFNADWCGPCKRIAPKLDELASQYAERAIVLSVNVDEHVETTKAYNIRSMPTFVFVRCGHILESFAGSDADRLSKAMDTYANDIHVPEMDLKLEQKQLPNSPMESVDEAAHMVTESAELAATNNTNSNSNENLEITD